MSPPRIAASTLSRIAICLLLALILVGASARAHDYSVLVFSKTAGFRHGSIAAGIAAIQQLGVANDFGVTATEDATQFNAANLAQFKAVVFLNTTGDVLDAAQQTAFGNYIRAGGGFVGVHAAADTEYTWPWYGALVGAYFANHSAVVQGEVQVLDRAHPSTSGLPQRWVRTDEWYNFQTSPRGTVHVLATMNETTYTGGTMGHDHPIAWCQEYDGGRSWYTALGHTTASYTEPLFLNHLLKGIEWAAGHVAGDAGATVNSRYQKLVLDGTVSDPMALDVAPNGDVFFVERRGKVKVYSPVFSSTTTVGTLDVFSGLEDGLLGIALDPNFATNGWIYLMYSPTGAVPKQHVSRFTIANGQLSLASEVVLLTITTQRDQCCHSGGDLEFDGHGNLFISVGDNTNPFSSSGFVPIDERAGRSAWDAQISSGNTNDLRGKILRIRPETNGSYTIPAGNLFPVGTALTRPEIFTMGLRNPFRIAIDRTTGWLYWGDVGPDANADSATRGPKGHDEFNQARTAGNFGWPYFVGNNKAYNDYDFATGVSGPLFNAAAPVNNSPNNTGQTTLPPAQPAWIWYPYGTSSEFPALGTGSRTAMAGAFYRYNPSLVSDVAFPAYFDNSFFLMEWSRNLIADVKIDTTGAPLKITSFAPTIPLLRPMDMKFGPDGALYLIEWGSSFGGNNTDSRIVKIIYNSGNKFPVPVAGANVTSGSVPLSVTFSSAGSHDPDPTDTITFAWDFDSNGTVDSTLPNPTHTYNVAGNYVAQLRVTDSRGKSAAANLLISAGNHAPVVTATWPPNGAFFDWGDEVAYAFSASDFEDGAVPTEDIEIEFLLGHDSHGHTIGQAVGGSGFVTTLNAHSFEDNTFFAIEASYLDQGAPPVAPVRGTATRQLQPKIRQAEHFTSASGVATATSTDPVGGGRDVTGIDHGDFLSFTPMNLLNIQEILFRVAGTTGGRIEVRADSSTGPLLANVVVPAGGATTYRDVKGPVSDPGGTRTLFFVFLRNPGDTDLFRVNWIGFRGPGAAHVAKAPRLVSASTSPPYNSVVVAFDDAMDFSSLVAANFSINGSVAVLGVTPSADQRSVTLQTTPIGASQGYLLTANGVRDLAGDAIAPGAFIAFRPRTLVTAINCGGSTVTASDGIQYLSDRNFTGGSVFSTTGAIAGTLDDALYQSERWGAFTYQVPVTNGLYYVTLKFAEIFHTAVNQRVFTVNLEGSPAVTSLDIFSKVGSHAAYDVTVPVTVSDGSLTLTVSSIVGNPKLSAFAVYAAPEPYTDFASWRTFHFGASPGPGSNAGDDPEGDGLINWFEYVYGGNPTANDGVQNMPRLELDDPLKLTISYRKAVTTATYTPQWTPNLLPATWSSTGFSSEVYHAPSDRYRRSLPILSGDTRKFIRLEISGN